MMTIPFSTDQRNQEKNAKKKKKPIDIVFPNAWGLLLIIQWAMKSSFT